MKSPLSIMRLLVAAVNDIQRLLPGVKGLDRDVITIKARFKHEGIGYLSVAFPTFCDSLDRGLASGRFACPTGFKRNRCGALPKLFSGLLCEVFDDTGQLKSLPSKEHVKCLREVLRLFKKFRLSTDRDEELDRRAVGTFWDAEARIQESTFDPIRASLLSRVGGFALSGLDYFEPSQLQPRHGPGAVCEKMAPNQKWSGVYSEIQNGSRFIEEYGLGNFSALQIAEEAQASLQCSRLPVLVLDEGVGLPGGTQRPSHETSSGDIARLLTVAKSSSARRTITVEPLMNMFIQQGLNTYLRERITRCSVLSNCLALTDQSKNQKLALEGSYTGEWSTIDLSSASDLLSLSMVERVFAKHPGFLSRMVGCRSRYVLDQFNMARRISKFAGMGNALTFPVQSVCFAITAISAILYAEGKFRPSYGDVVRVSRLVRVYGDDIIVQTKSAYQVMEWLESFGLLVNRKKTFAEGNFRESCGVDAYAGVDVTPVYVRHDPLLAPVDASALSASVSACNQLWLAGRYQLSNEIRQMIEETFGFLPLLSKTSGALGWVSRTDSTSAQKWDSTLQRLVVRAPVVVAKVRRDPLDGWPALLKSFMTPLIQRGPGHLKRSIKRYETRVAWRWMPANAG